MDFLLYFLLLFEVTTADQVIIETPLGLVRGFETWSFQNHLFYSFLGIPYAKPPVGPARFNYSEPIEPWNGVFDADRHMPCLQFEQATSYIRGVEDCLVVSIYTPKLPSVEDPLLIPVFVWLHGNDFHRGSGNADLQGPNRIMDYDVIMVTMNFRLGPLGFMTLEDDTLPGNLGLWDQKLALEWIQLNIASFGGDPEKITIAGSGAGGTSVLLHYISPHSCGLFRSAIALSPTSFPSTNVSHYTKALVSKLGCDSPEKILECLSTKTSEAFVRKAYMFTSPNMNWAPMPFTAIIDDFATKPFVPLHPLEAIKKGLFNDVPLIIGHNRDEGASILTQLTHNMTIFDHFLKHWNKIAPVMLFNKLEQDLENEHFEVVKILNQRYFGQENGPKSRGNFLANFGQFYTDAKVGFHVHYIANEVFKKSESPIFQYLYSHAGSLSLAEVVHLDFWQVLWKFFGRFLGLDLYPSSNKYAAHADDQLLIFNTNSLPFDGAFTSKDQNVSRNLLKLWTYFVKNGSSNIQHWFPLTPDNLQRMEISTNGIQMIPNDKVMLNFWTNQIWPLIKSSSSSNAQNYQSFQDVDLHNNLENKDEL